MPGRNGGTPIDPGFLQRAAAGLRYVVTSRLPDWFGPLDPLPPVAQEQAQGRQFDYTPGNNLQTQPRANEPITFQQLRLLADNYDLVRLCIERRKNQLA